MVRNQVGHIARVRRTVLSYFGWLRIPARLHRRVFRTSGFMCVKATSKRFWEVFLLRSALNRRSTNTILSSVVLPRFTFQPRTRALCVLDPYKLTPDWKVVKQAGQSRAIEVFMRDEFDTPKLASA